MVYPHPFAPFAKLTGRMEEDLRATLCVPPPANTPGISGENAYETSGEQRFVLHLFDVQETARRKSPATRSNVRRLKLGATNKGGGSKDSLKGYRRPTFPRAESCALVSLNLTKRATLRPTHKGGDALSTGRSAYRCCRSNGNTSNKRHSLLRRVQRVSFAKNPLHRLVMQAPGYGASP